MIKEITHPSSTIFQRLQQAASRARQGQETADDLVLFIKHPELARIILKFKS